MATEKVKSLWQPATPDVAPGPFDRCTAVAIDGQGPRESVLGGLAQLVGRAEGVFFRCKKTFFASTHWPQA
jgi:hypothetical protein